MGKSSKSTSRFLGVISAFSLECAKLITHLQLMLYFYSPLNNMSLTYRFFPMINGNRQNFCCPLAFSLTEHLSWPCVPTKHKRRVARITTSSLMIASQTVQSSFVLKASSARDSCLLLLMSLCPTATTPSERQRARLTTSKALS